MKKITLLSFMVFLLGLTAVKAAETEPNNTKAQANTLALSGSNTGAINVSGDEDWWKITTTGDGKLNVTITISNGLYMHCYIYDNNGTTQLNTDYTKTTITVSADGLAAGTYYVKLIAYYAGQLPAYTISNTLTLPAQANDTEPNDAKPQAVILPLNNSKTGHSGYYYNNKRDSSDWYQVTTNADGRLRLTLSSGNGQYIYAYLYDNDGVTLLENGYTSGTAAVINTDGLAAGTYYIRIKPYYASGFIPYTLYDSLFLPAQANDAEPNDTKAQAVTIPLNNSKTGHSGYYYNNKRDSSDWYKVTTNADGRLRLTLSSGNGQYIYAYLYDNDGVTLLDNGYTSGTAAVINKDGLAAGTYFIRIKPYYASGFIPYILYDSLFKPVQANDTEPNNSRAQAIVLPLNGSKTGHVNYYYNKLRDSSDWYKLITDKDGMITATIQSHNSQYVWVYLYDNNGTTVLASDYTTSTVSVKYDGLRPGTYYVRVKAYYANDWIPYTLSNSLTTYTYDEDNGEPNSSFSKAKTIPSDASSSGHVNFYYNGVADTADYHKINYTGTGNLTLVLNLENRLKYGSTTYTYLKVYKDTAASPIYNEYFNANTSGNINLTNLTQGYYYIKVHTYYNGAGTHFSSYSITNTYTQVNKAALAVTAFTATSCDSVNSITFKPSKSKPPYKIQLYRFGVAYGNPVTTKNQYTFNNLPAGSYYATVYGDGATGTAFGKSKVIAIEPMPTGLNTTNITAVQARPRWTTVVCADYYTVQYRANSATQWTTKKTTGNINNLLIKNLTPNTKYYWRVATSDSANGITATGAYADSISFKTAASFTARDEEGPDAISINNEITTSMLKTFPNPATSYFIIDFKQSSQAGKNVIAQLFDASGRSVWSSGLISAETLNGKQVNADRFGKGVFYLKILTEDGSVAGSAKVMIVK